MPDILSPYFFEKQVLASVKRGSLSLNASLCSTLGSHQNDIKGMGKKKNKATGTKRAREEGNSRRNMASVERVITDTAEEDET